MVLPKIWSSPIPGLAFLDIIPVPVYQMENDMGSNFKVPKFQLHFLTYITNDQHHKSRTQKLHTHATKFTYLLPV